MSMVGFRASGVHWKIPGYVGMFQENLNPEPSLPTYFPNLNRSVQVDQGLGFWISGFGCGVYGH